MLIDSYDRRWTRIKCSKSWCTRGTRWVPAGTDVDAGLVARGWQVRVNPLGVTEHRCPKHHRPEKEKTA